LDGIIKAQPQTKGTPIKSLLKQDWLAEQVHKTAQLVQAAINSDNCPSALNAVIGPNPKGQCQEFNTRHTLEKACLEEVGHWFSQTNDTPFLQNPFLKIFGKIGTNQPAFKQV